ncbi:protein DBF4 homolog A-like [Hydractinia symbiolongicarpus]|uniref:protein DBF4 homolog A-like n=1 Tax=Hydractinia symbiolongicarpus TaxID=13093 RepID=UPI00254E4E9D|nr:protein DBF4 homolog A-like [Hydractinia symbiolongicarpus]
MLEGQKTVIEVEGEYTYNEKYNLSSINVYCDTIIFIVLKEPYMIIRDRENLFKPLIYKTKIPNLHFEKGCLFKIDKEITRHDSCDTRATILKPQDVADDGFCECCKIRYTSLQQHLDSDRHKSFVTNKENYDKVDQLIAKGVSFDDFVEACKKKAAKKILKRCRISFGCEQLKNELKLDIGNTSDETKKENKESPLNDGRQFEVTSEGIEPLEETPLNDAPQCDATVTGVEPFKETPLKDARQCDATVTGVEPFKGINNSLNLVELVLLFTCCFTQITFFVKILFRNSS